MTSLLTFKVWKNFRTHRLSTKRNLRLTMLAIMSVLSERTQTKVTAARKLYTRSTIVARVVLAHRHLARRSEIARGAFALPAVLKSVR